MVSEDRTVEHGVQKTSRRRYIFAAVVFVLASAIAIVFGVTRSPEREIEKPVEVKIKPKDGGPAAVFGPDPWHKGVFIIDTKDMMGGVQVRISGWGLEKNDLLNAFNAALDRMRELDAKLSAYKLASEITGINDRAGREAFKVSKDTMDVMQRSSEWCEYFAGRLDFTVGPFIDLWKKCEEEDREPEQDELGLANEFVDFSLVEISENESTIMLPYDGMRLDLGATAKGFMVDEAAAVLKEKGLKGFMIIAGGDGYAHGLRADGSKWGFGIADPKPGSQGPTPQTSKYVRELYITGYAVTTSGNYARGYKIGGKWRSHIINPLNGEPCDSVPSVTAVALDALAADACATGFSVMAHDCGIEQTIDTAEMTDNVEILILIHKDGKLVAHQTKGFEKYLVK